MVVASKGGSDAPLVWYLNLSENPEVYQQNTEREIPIVVLETRLRQRPLPVATTPISVGRQLLIIRAAAPPAA